MQLTFPGPLDLPGVLETLPPPGAPSIGDLPQWPR